MTTQLLPVRQFQKAIWTIDPYFRRLCRNDLDAESSGLDHRAACQIGSGESTRKAEVVFNPARHAGLSARRFAFDHYGSQTLARAVDRGGQSGWTTSDDGKIVERLSRACSESGVFGKVYE